MAKKIAIISCGNVRNDCNCPGGGCFRSFNTKTAVFERYKDEDIELVAYNTCAGCPTIMAQEKILKKVKPIVELCQPDVIHFSSCMAKMCPFVQKYKTIIGQHYPQVELVMGTDADPNGPPSPMHAIFKDLLCKVSDDFTDEVIKLKKGLR